jgi:two-component system nitrogen regulation response regulator NtrX
MLQEQTFMRNTGEQELEVDVRIIATSNRDVKKAIEKGEFREDLYYRLNVVPINVPSLEYRREDIPCLMQYFMQKAAADTGVKPLEITREAAMILQSYNWPGNVRQLKNIMDWLVVMYGHTDDNKIYSNMLPSEISFSKVVSMPSGKMHEYLSMNIKDAREAFEKDYLTNVLNKNKGNVSETARQIGMERSALHRKLKMLGIN